MFDVGIPELVLILVVALVVFGPGKLPEVGASIGKAMREFRKATQSVTDEIESVTNSVTKLESEDEMRTRLITEQNRKRAAAAAAAAAVAQEAAAPAAIAPASPQFETPTPVTVEPMPTAPVEPAVSASPEVATNLETSTPEPATTPAEAQS